RRADRHARTLRRRLREGVEATCAGRSGAPIARSCRSGQAARDPVVRSRMGPGARPQVTMRTTSKRSAVTRALAAALIATVVSAGVLTAGAPARGDPSPQTKTKGVLTVA